MSIETLQLLRAFEALAPGEKEEFVRELLQMRAPAVDLRARGMDEAKATDLRARLKTFAEDWDRPEMGVYDVFGCSGEHYRETRRRCSLPKRIPTLAFQP